MKEHSDGTGESEEVIKVGIPQAVATAIPGHKTDSMFRRNAIMDKSDVQEAFQVLQTQ